jgi:hypothetical protein
MSVFGDPAPLNRDGAGPLPHPTAQSVYPMGGRVGEQAGTAPTKVEKTLKTAGFRSFIDPTRAENLQ